MDASNAAYYLKLKHLKCWRRFFISETNIIFWEFGFYIYIYILIDLCYSTGEFVKNFWEILKTRKQLQFYHRLPVYSALDVSQVFVVNAQHARHCCHLRWSVALSLSHATCSELSSRTNYIYTNQFTIVNTEKKASSLCVVGICFQYKSSRRIVKIYLFSPISNAVFKQHCYLIDNCS